MQVRGKLTGGSALTITALTLLLMGWTAFTLPAAPIRSEVTARAGYLVGHGRFSDRLAEQLARNGYTYLVVDLTTGENADWNRHLEIVTQRRFESWGWIELDSSHERGAKRTAEIVARDTPGDKARVARAQAAAERATADWKIEHVVPALNLKGLYVYGPGAVAKAARLNRKLPFAVVPVLRSASEGAVAMDYDTFVAANEFNGTRILIADQLPLAKIETARGKVRGGYVIARVPILERK